MPHPIMFTDGDFGLAEVRTIALAFPGAVEEISHGRPVFRAGKIFTSFGASRKIKPGEHEPFPHSIIIKSEDPERAALVQDPRFFIPAYWGPSGWLALDFDAAEVDWDEVAELIDASYRLIASAKLVGELDARDAS